MAITLGADPEALDGLALRLEAGAAQLDAVYLPVRAAYLVSTWLGGDSDAFGNEWDGPSKARLNSSAVALRDAATQLRRNADEQRNASAAGAGNISRGPSSSQPVGYSSDNAESDIQRLISKLDHLLMLLGIPQDAIATMKKILEHALKTKTSKKTVDAAEDLFKFFDGHKGFVKAMNRLGTAAAIGGFIASFAGDFLKNPDLPTDERILHAGVVGAVKSTESAATTAAMIRLGAIIGSAVGPPLGTVAGVAVGAVVGFGAQEGVEYLDSHFGLSEEVADKALQRYQADKQTAIAVGNAVSGIGHAVENGAKNLVNMDGNIIGGPANIF